MSYKLIHSKTVFKGRTFNVRVDQVRLPDNRVTELDIVDHTNAVVIVPVDLDHQIWFIRQYRHATGKEILELPAGTLEKNEDPEKCARREIREEIGMAARFVQSVGEFYLAPGYSTEYLNIYMATDLYPSPLEGDVDEIIHIERIPFERAFAMIEGGEIHDAKTLAALSLVRHHLFSE